jgi:predicted dehydrogenase
LKALIVGLGSAGHRHTRNLKSIDPAIRIAVWRQHSRTGDLGDLSSLVEDVFYCQEDALAWQPDVAIVSTPASLHVPTALLLAHSGVHLFIEKPLSDMLKPVDELLALCHERGLALMVGYNFRFYGPLQTMRRALEEGEIGRVVSVRAEVGQYLPDWRPGVDYRQSVSARRDLGGGALLELSHELDYLRWLNGEVKAVSAQIAHLSDLDIDVEDTAEIILQFCNGSIGSIHLDMIQRPATRTCRIVGTEGTLTWDWSCHRVKLFSATTNKWTEPHLARSIDRNEMYVAELRHFLDCAKGDDTPNITGEDGRRVLEIALAARQSSEDQRVVEV